MNKGFTLLELMIAAAIIIFCLAGMLATFVACLEMDETTKNMELALNSAQDVLEDIRNTPITSVESIYNGFTFQVPELAAGSSQGYVYVDDSDPKLLDVVIGVCWQQKNSRIIGECINSGGAVSFSDGNGNGYLDSIAQLRTVVGMR